MLCQFAALLIRATQACISVSLCTLQMCYVHSVSEKNPLYALEHHQVAQRSCGCPITSGVQDQVGWDPEQPKLVSGNPAHIRGLELDGL